MPTTLELEVDGFIQSAGFVFTDNKHFGKNPLCSPLYHNPDTPKFSNYCIKNDIDTFAIVRIVNFDNFFNYSISPTPLTGLDASGNFHGHIDSIYNVSVSDSLGCTITSKVKVGRHPNLITDSIICTNINPAPNAIIYASANGQNGPFEFQNLNNGVGHDSVPQNVTIGLNFTQLGLDTIVVIDSIGCTDTALVVYQQLIIPPPTTALPPICPWDSINIQISAVVDSPDVLTFTWLPGNFNGNPVVVNPTSSTIYTCVVSSASGCVDTGYQAVVVNPNPDVLVSQGGTICNPEFTASINTLNPATYVWSGILGPSTLNPVNAPFSNPPNPPNTGTYTVTATDANGCTGTTSGSFTQDPMCCTISTTFPSISYLFSPLPPYSNGTAFAVQQTFSSSTISTSSYIYFDGTININVNLNFVNCPHLLFSPNCRLIIANGVTLSFNNCSLKAECDYMWDGIESYFSTSTLFIHNSTISDMQYGFMLHDGAKIDCDNNHFINNWVSLAFFNAPNGYGFNSSSVNCKVINSEFYSNGNLLLQPYSSEYRGQSAITITNCKTVVIGQLGLQSYNVVRNLYNGVRILTGSTSQVEKYSVLNTLFDNIQNEPGLNTNVVSDQNVISNWNVINQYVGCAIHARPITPPGVFTPKHLLYVDYDQVDHPGHIVNCDKAVVTQYTSSYISNAKVGTTLLGFMFGNPRAQNYRVLNNKIGDINKLFNGVFCNANNGPTNYFRANDNLIITRNSDVNNNYPKGITFQNFTLLNNKIFIENNVVYMHAVAGTGINTNFCGANNLIQGNHVYLWMQYPNLVLTVPRTGIMLNNCSGSKVLRNIVFGNGTLLKSSNVIECIRLSNSPNCNVECNELHNAPMGMRVLGNCNTGLLNVRGNSFNYHGNGMHFGTLGLEGTLGNIGDNLNDNNNTFSQSNLFDPPMQYSVFRYTLFTNSWFPGQIRTPQTTLPSGESGAYPSTLLGRYTPLQNNPGFTSFPTCTGIQNFSSAVPSTINFNIQEALAIVNQDSTFTNLSEETQWMEERRLVDVLFRDSVLRTSNPDLNSYYQVAITGRLDEFAEIDYLIEQFADSTISEDSAKLESIIDRIEMLNNEIASSNQIELDEKTANNYFIQMVKYANNTLTEADKIWLENMALSCPFEKGIAVYKARSLYASFNPMLDYDDYYICNNTASKGGIGDLLAHAVVGAGADKNEKSKIRVYPNPADDVLKVQYQINENQQANFVICDLLGNSLIHTNLKNQPNPCVINTSSLQSGIYLYKFVIDNRTIETGKITIN